MSSSGVSDITERLEALKTAGTDADKESSDKVSTSGDCTFPYAERPPIVSKLPGADSVVVYTNHFRLQLKMQDRNVYQYSVAISCRNKQLTKREKCRPIFWRLVEEYPDVFPDVTHIVYNDVNILWTFQPIHLPSPTWTPSVSGDRYQVEIKPTSGLILDFNGPDPITSLTFLDALMSQKIRCPLIPEMHNRFVTHGHSAFIIPQNAQEERLFAKPIGLGLEALAGLHSAIKPMCRGGVLLNCDVSHTVFRRRRWSLIDVMLEVCSSGMNHQLSRDELHHLSLNYNQRFRINKLLKGVGLMTLYEVRGKQQFLKFLQVCDKSASSCMIHVLNPDNDRVEEMSVERYFDQVRGIRLQYPYLPLGRRDREIFIPMELLSTSKTPDRMVGQLPEREKAGFIRAIQQSPSTRVESTLRMMKEAHIESDEWTTRYGFNVESEMVKAPALVLPKPLLQFGGVSHEPDKKAYWPLWDGSRSYSQARFSKALKLPGKFVYGVIFVHPVHFDRARHANNLRALEMCNKAFGLEVIQTRGGEPQFGGEWNPEPQRGETDVDPANRLLRIMKGFKTDVREKFGKEVKPLMLVVMPRKHAQHYGLIKYIGECEVGVHVQCVLQKVFEMLISNASNSTAHNLTLKIIAKLGGTHYQINDETYKSWVGLTNEKSPTLFLGIDVTHPSVQEKVDMKNDPTKWYPSIASIVGNEDVRCTRWGVSTKVQAQSQEMVVHCVDQVVERINAFVQGNNGAMPANVVVYRDGVSETEYKKIMHEELSSIKAAFMRLDPNFSPKVVYIAMQKRHHVRFFTPTGENQVAAENVAPGTLVQDVVTHRKYFDFFLASHFGSLGTSRPAHYVVLYDELKPKPITWQTVTYALCFLYYRTPRAVSQPAPVFYAHLSARRARYHWDAAQFLYPKDRDQDGDSFTKEIAERIRLHPDIRDVGMHFC